jgi:predicted CoA-binding protein
MAEHAERREPEAESACELPQGNPPDSEVRRLLGEIRTVAIVGLSDNPERDSYRVAAYLQKQGLRILPVNPNVREVLGEKAYGDLVSLPVKPDAVVVFRRPEAVPAIVEQATQIGAKVRQAGMHVVQNRCIMQEHQRLLKTNDASAQ